MWKGYRQNWKGCRGTRESHRRSCYRKWKAKYHLHYGWWCWLGWLWLQHPWTLGNSNTKHWQSCWARVCLRSSKFPMILFPFRIKLKTHYVHPTCTPSRAAFMTGRYSANTGLPFAMYPGKQIILVAIIFYPARVCGWAAPWHAHLATTHERSRLLCSYGGQVASWTLSAKAGTNWERI